MSRGQTTPFRGSRYAVLSGVLPSRTLTALSKANPAVASVANHGMTNGDVVRIANVSPTLDGDYAIKYLTDGTFQLLGLDTTGATFALTATSSAAQGTWLDICELTNVQEAGRTISQIDTSTICSEEQESEPGLPAPGTVQLSFNAAPDVDSQSMLADYETNGQKFWTRLALSRGRGFKLYWGYISTGAGLDGAVNGLFTSGLTIQLSGPKYYVKAAVAA